MKTHYFSLLLGITLFSCHESTDQTKPSKQALAVDGYIVTPHEHSNYVTTTADLLPYEQVEIKAPIAGEILNIYFKEGRTINKGDKIIHIYDKNWKAQLVGLEAELQTAKSDLERKKNLLDIEGSTQEEIDIAFAQCEQLKSQIALLRLNIELANITAPFSGTLGMRNFSKGTYLKAGDIITTLTATTKLKVDFNLPQEHVKSVEIGKNITMMVNGDTLNAKIYAINPTIDQTSRTIKVRAVLHQTKDNPILPGTYAEIILSTNFQNDALLVPTQAVVPEIEDQTVYIYRQGKAVRKTIQMGGRTADKVLITYGLSVGDTIITSALLQVKEGMDVQLQSITK